MSLREGSGERHTRDFTLVGGSSAWRPFLSFSPFCCTRRQNDQLLFDQLFKAAGERAELKTETVKTQNLNGRVKNRISSRKTSLNAHRELGFTKKVFCSDNLRSLFGALSL